MFVMCVIRHTVTSNLIKHIFKHNGDCPYVCDVCNKAYSDKYDPIMHKRKHSGGCPYVCDVCNKAYSDDSNLIKHICKHIGECPYVCDVCNKAYGDKSSLIKHKPIHSSEHPMFVMCVIRHSVDRAAWIFINTCIILRVQITD